MSHPSPLTVGIDIRLIGKQRTGDETVFFQLVRELIRQHASDIRYELYTDEARDDQLAALRLKLDALGREDVHIVSLPAKNRFLWNAIVLPVRLFRHPVDVFHTQYILPLLLPRRLKVVTHIHDVSFYAHPEWIGRSDLFFLRLFLPRTFSRSDCVIVPSEFTRSEVLEYTALPAQRIRMINNAVAEEWYQPISLEMIRAVTARYGLAPYHYFISSGTLQPRKNIPRLIEAFRRAVQTHGLTHALVLTGSLSGHNVDPQIQSATRGNIIYSGYVSDEDLRALVAGAAGYVFPSLYEGFGIPILEARAQGTAVLASDIPVFHEVGGEQIQYFNPCSLAQMTEKLYTFSIDNLEEKPEDKRFSSDDRPYSWTRSAIQLAQLYRLLGGRSS